jgi:hypothetical protein
MRPPPARTGRAGDGRHLLLDGVRPPVDPREDGALDQRRAVADE